MIVNCVPSKILENNSSKYLVAWHVVTPKIHKNRFADEKREKYLILVEQGLVDACLYFVVDVVSAFHTVKFTSRLEKLKLVTCQCVFVRAN